MNDLPQADDSTATEAARQAILERFPENPLEESVAAAIRDDAAVPAMLQALSRETLYVPIAAPAEATAWDRLDAEAPITVITVTIDEQRHVPFFSSESQALLGVPPEVALVAMPGAALFASWEDGVWGMLNGGGIGRRFSPEEMALLGERIDVDRLAEPGTDTTGLEIAVGEPAMVTPGLVEAVATTCARLPAVVAAYRAEVTLPTAADPTLRDPHLCVGMRVEGDTATVEGAFRTVFEAVKKVTEEELTWLLVDPAAPDAVSAYMMESTAAVYARDAPTDSGPNRPPVSIAPAEPEWQEI